MKKQFNYLGVEVHYNIHGKGFPVVLIHGFGEDSSIFDTQISFLKNHCLLIVPDLPGSGASKYNAQITTIDDFATCIHELLQHEKIHHCLVLGHSMGGYITLAFAQKYAPLLNGFGLLHSTAFADSDEKKQNRKRGIELIKTYGAHAFLKTTIPNLFGAAFKESSPEQVTALTELAKQFSADTLIQYYEAMIQRPDRTEVLKSNPLPVLFVLGTEDVAAPLNDVLQQTYLPQCSYIHILENVGHMGMWEATEKMNGLLLSFIQQVTMNE